MMNKVCAVLALALLSGCSGMKRSDSGGVIYNPRGQERAAAALPFALPGVPLPSDAQPAKTEAEKPEAQAAASAQAGPAADLPGEAAQGGTVTVEGASDEATPAAPKHAAVDPGDLTFHLNAAKKYAARKKYRSAAAEYAAALPFLPAGDTRAVRLLERQGAMLLKLGDKTKARGYFQAAVEKGKELNTAGDGLAEAYVGLGYCQEKADQAQDAIGSYEKALELSASKTVKDRLSASISRLRNARQ